MSRYDVLAIILGGGQGARLDPLTRLRAKPAVPFGGRYRLIDVPISNCLHSGINHIYVLTQFLPASLHRHIYQTYKFDVFSGGFVHILPAQATQQGMDWYLGTADAVRKQLSRLQLAGVEDVLVLSGDHLYQMDYAPFIDQHREKRADLTVAVQPVSRELAPRFGILKTAADRRITVFAEKPSSAELDGLQSGFDESRPFLASMGIYLFRKDVLLRALEQPGAEDFGKHVIPGSIETLRVFAHPFEGYWEDIGTVRSFYEANLALTGESPAFDLFDPKRKVFTRPRFLPPSRVDGCTLERAMLAEGCRLERAEIQHSIVGLRGRVGHGTQVTDSVLMGADFFETFEMRAENRRLGRPDVGVGENCRIEGAIVDKNARIGNNVIIRPRDPGAELEEGNGHIVRDGIVVVMKNAVIPDGTEI